VEAIRRTTGGSYLAAVQWHPEFHVPGSPDNFDDTAMLEDFLAAARAVKA
jgi:putative glutamine amidotransferase